MGPTIDQRAEAWWRIRARRFRGEDPAVTVPADAGPEELIARVLAAERLNAALALPGGTYNPQESLAETIFQGGVRALNAWAFREARRRFDDAARRAREPRLQQRIALFIALCALLQEAVRIDPERSLSTSHRENLKQTLPRLDCLSAAERAHYQAEVTRLYDLLPSEGLHAPCGTWHGRMDGSLRRLPVSGSRAPLRADSSSRETGRAVDRARRIPLAKCHPRSELRALGHLHEEHLLPPWMPAPAAGPRPATTTTPLSSPPQPDGQAMGAWWYK